MCSLLRYELVIANLASPKPCYSFMTAVLGIALVLVDKQVRFAHLGGSNTQFVGTTLHRIALVMSSYPSLAVHDPDHGLHHGNHVADAGLGSCLSGNQQCY